MMLAVLTLSASASADSTPATRDGQSLVFHQHRARAIIQDAYALSRWRDPTPAKPAEKRAWKQHRLAIEIPKVRDAISFHRERMARRFERHRDKRRSDWCAPNPHPSGAGCWVIPEPCVMGESGGSWTAHNPTSAARGPYQLNQHGEPWPVTSRAEAMAHHRIAAGLYAASGMAPWVHPAC